MSTLRAAIVTDIHYGRKVASKYGHKAPELVERFIQAAHRFGADAIIDMGDRISSKDENEDARHMAALYKHFNRAAAPVYCVHGNHDVKNLRPEDNAAITGNPATSHSVDLNGFHLTFWNPSFDKYALKGLVLEQNDLDWLERDIHSTANPVMLFSHVGLENNHKNKAVKNEHIYARFQYPNAGEAREIIEHAGNVILCLAGHRHKNRFKDINGIRYINLQSLTQARNGDKNRPPSRRRVPHGAYALMHADLQKRLVNIDVRGTNKHNYEINF